MILNYFCGWARIILWNKGSVLLNNYTGEKNHKHIIHHYDISFCTLLREKKIKRNYAQNINYSYFSQKNNLFS